MTTRGLLFFAFNNESIDYVKLATWSARRARRFLGVGSALVTDCEVKDSAFIKIINVQNQSDQKRWFPDYNQSVTWINLDRYRAWELSPFDETILLDADYVIASDALGRLWDIHEDIVCFGQSFDVLGQTDFAQHNYFGQVSMPSAWATVVKFRKTTTSAAVFEVWQRVQRNWNHYRNLYGIQQSTFRNDYALAIAMHVVFGNCARYPEIPWNLPSVLPEHTLSQKTDTGFEITYARPNSNLGRLYLDNMDFHAMGKKHLQEIITT